MSELEPLWQARSSFGLAAFFLTWLTIALLAAVALGLHLRLRRLESRLGPVTAVPYRRLLGRSLADLVPVPSPRAILMVSSGCRSCARLLEEVGHLRDRLVLASKDQADLDVSLVPLRSLDSGPAIANRLRIGVTPFLLVLDSEARITAARPVGSRPALERALEARAPEPGDRGEAAFHLERIA